MYENVSLGPTVSPVGGDSRIFGMPHGRHANSPQRPVTDFRSVPASLTALRQDVPLSSSVLSDSRRTRQRDGLDRPVTNRDIAFLSGCYQVAEKPRQVGWLMLQEFGYSAKDIDSFLKDMPHYENSVKIIHVIGKWIELKDNRATARELVNICCHNSVCVDRWYIENSLTSTFFFDGFVHGKLVSFKQFCTLCMCKI